MLRISRRRGFSLIELTFVMILLGIIASVIAYVLSTGIQGSLKSRDLDTIDWKSRGAIERIARGLREVRPSQITTLTSSQLSYTNLDGSTVTYQYTAPNLLRNSKSLANNVTSFSFSYYTATGTTTTTASQVRYILIAAIFQQGSAISPIYYTTVTLQNL